MPSSDGARSKIIWAMAKLELKLDKLVSQARRVGLLEDYEGLFPTSRAGLRRSFAKVAGV